MGEYAIRISDGEEIKVGTCESMYYIRYEDRFKVRKLSGNVDCAKEMNMFWRIPFPDEDNILPGNYEDYNRGYPLYHYDGSGAEAYPGIVQYHNESGLHINMKCYHGIKLPEGNEDFRAFWNGKNYFWELAHIKNTDEGIKAVVRCKYCGHMWREEIDNIIDLIYDRELQKRLWTYVHNEPMHACTMCYKTKTDGKGCCKRTFQTQTQDEEYNYKAPDYRGIRYGSEINLKNDSETCPECGCKKGTYHHIHCMQEECPICGLQAETCGHYRCYDLHEE